MKSFQTFKHLVSHLPDHFLAYRFFGVLIAMDEMGQISPFQKLSNDAEGLSEFIVERILVGNNLWILDAGEDANFIEAVGQFLFRKVHDLHFLHSIVESILLSVYLIDY